MGMQVHFKLSDVLERCAVALQMERHDELPDFSGTVTKTGISFTIVPKGDLPSNDCWADVVHNRDIVNWLIDQRVPFNAS